MCYPGWTARSVQCFNIGTLATDCVFFFFPFLSEMQLQVGESEAPGGGRGGGGGGVGWNPQGTWPYTVKVSRSPPPLRSNKPPCLSVPEQDPKSPPQSPRPCSVAVLSPQRARLRGRKKKSPPQGINYNVISHYNYYRLLSHRDTPNHQLFFFIPFCNIMRTERLS